MDRIEPVDRESDAKVCHSEYAVSSSVEETEESLPAPSADARWKIISASVTGTSHQASEQPCQDSNCHRVVEDVLVAVVADGAGSASLSQEGSTVASQAAVDKACELLSSEVKSPEEILVPAFSAAVDAVKSRAESRKKPLRDFATTLIVTVCMPDRTIVGQVGDGASVAMLEGSGEYRLLVQPERGEYINETQFITSRSWRESLRLVQYDESVEFLAMFTDGLEHLSLVSAAGYAPHVPFFNPLLSWTKEQVCDEAAHKTLRSFLKSPKITSRADDDLTLLLAIREKVCSEG